MKKNEENKFLEIYLSVKEKEKKYDFSDFFYDFPAVGNKRKKIFIMTKKKNWCITNWATAQLYCEKKKYFFVLQYSFCIAEKEA